MTVREQDIILDAGHIALLRVSSAFKLRTEAKGYAGVFFSAFNDPEPEFTGSAVACVADPTARDLAGLMQAEIDRPRTGGRDVLASIGRALAWQAIRLAADSSASSERTEYSRYWTDCAKQAINANLFTARDVRDILSTLTLSYRQLSRYFVQCAGMTPKEYQMRARIIEAQRLLTETSLPVTTIAYELNYPSSQHFATQFRKLTGDSPGDYRRATKNASRKDKES